MMKSKIEHRREQDEEEYSNFHQPLLPAAYQDYINDRSNIMDQYGDLSQQEGRLPDYMSSKFTSKQLPDNIAIHNSVTPSATA